MTGRQRQRQRHHHHSQPPEAAVSHNLPVLTLSFSEHHLLLPTHSQPSQQHSTDDGHIEADYVAHLFLKLVKVLPMQCVFRIAIDRALLGSHTGHIMVCKPEEQLRRERGRGGAVASGNNEKG